ncbi:TE1-like protein [Mya arenaria]|uniref:TE1-like protein n=1 Tax=Mya arenaria TaxID=6604 RepID=A0ABY7GAC4_MYAAR|nr:TE1-like protein [Mya arenaria]
MYKNDLSQPKRYPKKRNPTKQQPSRKVQPNTSTHNVFPRQNSRHEDEYVQQTLTKCSTYVYDLIICLAEEKSFKFEIKKCDDLLAKTFICLSSGEEVSIAHVQQETEENEDQIIIKRGLGRCIHQCLKGQGKMNFIQCKSMCHK